MGESVQELAVTYPSEHITGIGVNRTNEWDAGYRYTRSKAYAIDISAKSKGNNAFITQLRISHSQLCAFLLESGFMTISEFEDLYVEMQQEIQEEQFCGLLYVRTVVASLL